MLYSVLGNKKIKRSLGKDLFIYPFKECNLKGSSYNLTASKVAYLLSNEQIAINGKGEIVVPAGETVLIQTEESIYTRKNICGTYHSKVKLVARGFSHIGTTLDPGYFGASLIALTNTTKETKKIKCGETIVTLMFYRVSGCDKELWDNSPNRDDLIPESFSGFKENLSNIQKEEFEKEINKIRNEDWKTDPKILIDKVRKENNIKSFGWVDFMILVVFIMIIISIIVCYIKITDKTTENTITLLGILITVILTIIPWIDNLFKRNKR